MIKQWYTSLKWIVVICAPQSDAHMQIQSFFNPFDVAFQKYPIENKKNLYN